MIKLKAKILYISSGEDEISSYLKSLDYSVLCIEDISIAKELINLEIPDLILIHSSLLKESTLEFCNYIKELNIKPRCIIVFIVDENSADEKIDILRSGADDAISLSTPLKETVTRISAHIRRRIETHINPLTGLPDALVTSRVLNDCIKNLDDWAVLSIDLDNLRIYNESYGEARGNQMIKALAAVLKSVQSGEDFLSHVDSDDFILITSSKKAESIAEEICRRFDMIANHFYTQKDAERGYVIGVGPSGVKRRVQLAAISIGITSKSKRNFKSEVEVMQVARDMRYLAKSKNGSDWVSDRPRLPSSTITELDKKIKVLIIEPDAPMSLLLRDTLEMEGYNVEVSHSPIEAWEIINTWRPELVLLETDISVNDFDGWMLATKIKQEPSLSGIWMVMTTKDPDHKKALDAGADLYFPKPYELSVLFPEIKYLVRTRIRSKIFL